MLRMSVAAEEFLMIGDNIKIVFLGGTKNNARIMIDAPKDVKIVRSKALENSIKDEEVKKLIPKYHREEEHPEKWMNKSKGDDRPKKRYYTNSK